MMRFSAALFCAARMDQAISGIPLIGRRFFRESPRDAPRAGMSPTILTATPIELAEAHRGFQCQTSIRESEKHKRPQKPLVFVAIRAYPHMCF